MSGETKKVVPFPHQAGNDTSESDNRGEMGPGAEIVSVDFRPQVALEYLRHFTPAIEFAPDKDGSGLELIVHLHPQVADIISKVVIQDDPKEPGIPNDVV